MLLCVGGGIFYVCGVVPVVLCVVFLVWSGVLNLRFCLDNGDWLVCVMK